MFTLEVTFFIRSSRNCVRMLINMKSMPSFKVRCDGSKSRPQGKKFIEKPYVHSRGHSFDPKVVKIFKNVNLNEISVRLECGSCLIKN